MCHFCVLHQKVWLRRKTPVELEVLWLNPIQWAYPVFSQRFFTQKQDKVVSLLWNSVRALGSKCSPSNLYISAFQNKSFFQNKINYSTFYLFILGSYPAVLWLKDHFWQEEPHGVPWIKKSWLHAWQVLQYLSKQN